MAADFFPHTLINIYTNLKLQSRQSEFSRRNGEVSDTNKQCADSDVDGTLERHTISDEDHPLKIGKASVWHQFFQVNDLLYIPLPIEIFVLC